MTTIPGEDGHPVYGKSDDATANRVPDFGNAVSAFGDATMRYANEDDNAKLRALIDECVQEQEAETIAQRSARVLEGFKAPDHTSVSLDLAEVTALVNGFLRRQGGNDGASREEAALDTLIFLKLMGAQQRLIERASYDQ